MILGIFSYGKEFATKVVNIKDSLPINDEKTCLDAIEMAPDHISSRAHQFVPNNP
jgi:hypothetical protein